MTYLTGPDISFYQDENETPPGIDFVKMKAAGAGYVIIRAGQRSWPDPDFATNWSMAKKAGLPRGSYWFYDSRQEPKKQAEKWIETVGWDLGELPLFADFEDEYHGIYDGFKNWKIFLARTRELAGTHEIGIYTAYYYWNEKVPVKEQDAFKSYPVLIANYVSINEAMANPDPLVPAPWGAQDWLFWQFTEDGDGKKYGAESNHIDLNLFNGDRAAFNARFKISETPEILPVPPPDPAPIQTYEGVMLYEVRRFGAKCIVHILDLSRVRIYVTPGGFRPVGQAVRKYGAQGGINGGGWPNVQTPGHRSNEIWASDGSVLQATALDDRPFIDISQASIGKIYRHASQKSSQPWNAWGLDRILGENGIFNPAISERTTKDARTGAGLTADNKLVLLSAEGNDYFGKGLTFPEMWEVLKEFGAMIAGNCDGGSSSTVINRAISESSLITPSDGQEANVINHVLFYASGGNISPQDPGGSMTTYRVLIPVKSRKTPSMFETATKPNWPAGHVFQSSVSISVTEKINEIIHIIDFVQMPDGYWIPLRYAGKLYVQSDASGETPPPTGPTLSHTIQIFSDGSITLDGKPYP